ncbi:coiled-coil domain-containing protein [Tateyamaria sp.]|uniref:coiled-coil domain-containing protein n=1 Tax=Tateyamaria sp. TaxID=1929288 RepID=UPI003B2225A9
MLHAAAIDTAQAIDELEAAGLDNKSARALVSVVNAAFTNTAATAADLREAEGRLEKQIIKQGAALDKRITEQGAAFEGRIVEVRTEIAEVRTEIAEVRTEIAESVNKTLRGMALLMGMALALGALWTAVVPAIRMALTGTP